mmetsp:Transcript_6386/g.12192  ORF Transcript_6386/g.12192 Transcript_6386/m.12192 type:complete len:199 (-) Transcript_6386:37-633(-)
MQISFILLLPNIPNFLFPGNAVSTLLPDNAVSTAKSNLLTFVSTLNRGVSSSPADRLRVDALVDDLLAVAPPPPAYAELPVLEADWRLEYTTEAELLGLMKNADTTVTQSIGADYLKNFVGFAGGFCEGWEFTVDSSISGSNIRSSFKFSAATLTLPWFDVPLPPVGEGWFDNLYVDEDVRINRESRGNTVVYTRIKN